MDSEVATISTMPIMMSASMNRQHPKDVIEEMSHVEQSLTNKIVKELKVDNCQTKIKL